MSVTSLWVAIRTTGAAQLTALQTRFLRLAATARVAISRMTSRFIASGGLLGVLGRVGARVQRLAGQIGSAMASAMGQIQRVFSNGISGLPPQAQAAIYGAGAAIAAGLASAIGAVLNGLLLTAVGGAVLGVGVAIAAKRSIIQDAFSRVFDGIGKDFSRFGDFFELPLLQVADVFSDTWSRISVDFGKSFEMMAGYVKPLAEGLGLMVERIMPGFNRAVEAAGPVLQQLADDLPMLGSAISDMFDSFAEGSDGAVKGIRALIMIVSTMLRMFGNAVEFLSKQWDKITNGMDILMSKLEKIPVIGKAFEHFADIWSGLNDTTGGYVKVMDTAAGSTGKTGQELEYTAEAAKRAAGELRKLSERMGELVNQNLSVDQAAIAWHKSLAELTASVQEHGRSLGLNTEAGRANRESILGAVEAAERARQAAIDLAGGENASKEAVQAANAAFQKQITDLEALMRKLGFTQAEIDKVIGKYRDLSNMPDIQKQITFMIRQRTIGTHLYSPSQLSGQYSSGIGGYAKGTKAAPPGWAWVGEEGPELVKFRGGEQVATSEESYAMASARRTGNQPVGRNGGGGDLMVRGGDGAAASFVRELVRVGALTLSVRNNKVVVA